MHAAAEEGKFSLFYCVQLTRFIASTLVLRQLEGESSVNLTLCKKVVDMHVLQPTLFLVYPETNSVAVDRLN